MLLYYVASLMFLPKAQTFALVFYFVLCSLLPHKHTMSLITTLVATIHFTQRLVQRKRREPRRDRTEEGGKKRRRKRKIRESLHSSLVLTHPPSSLSLSLSGAIFSDIWLPSLKIMTRLPVIFHFTAKLGGGEWNRSTRFC